LGWGFQGARREPAAGLITGQPPLCERKLSLSADKN